MPLPISCNCAVLASIHVCGSLERLKSVNVGFII